MPLLSNITKKDSDKAVEVNSQGGTVSDARNWYSDRYETLIVQRNVLFLISLIAVIATIFASFVVLRVTMNKEIIPMLVEVEDKTGFTNIVNPEDSQIWTSDKALNEYFLMKYMEARETYNIASYLYNYDTVVRVMSTSQVYNQFKSSISGSSNPAARYGASNSTSLQIRSIQYLPSSSNGDKNVQVRFTIVERQGGKYYNKIVSILYNFVQMQLTMDERMVNPLGFQVKSYAVADDVDVNL